MGALLSAHFDGDGGGLFAPGTVDVSAQDTLLAAVSAKVPEAEVAGCPGPGGDGLITAACLSAALDKAPGGRAPGSDGLTYAVYRTFWAVLAPPLAACFNEAFLEQGDAPALPASQLRGVITLLHKGEGKPLDQLAAYRPITLQNCDANLLARVLVARMAPACEAVVDPTQTAFLPGRWIGDNLLHHLEVLDYCASEAEQGCVLFLDFEKAFDRLDRGWLFRCLDAFGFPLRFCCG